MRSLQSPRFRYYDLQPTSSSANQNAAKSNSDSPLVRFYELLNISWLRSQTRDIACRLVRQIPAKSVIFILKQLFTSGSVNSGE